MARHEWADSIAAACNDMTFEFIIGKEVTSRSGSDGGIQQVGSNMTTFSFVKSIAIRIYRGDDSMRQGLDIVVSNALAS